MTPYNIERFISAQKRDFERALSEIKAGRKLTHWMWYIFPQIRGLGKSEMALYYGISDLDEAIEYINEPYLRDNLINISRALLLLESSDPLKILGYIDSQKLLSCMTLFELAAPDIPEFSMVITKFYGGKRDKKTITSLIRL